jgi:ATP phosphoribosyltransferase regulatory subunit HisZ
VNPATGFDSLPVELQNKIFEQLDEKDLASLALVANQNAMAQKARAQLAALFAALPEEERLDHMMQQVYGTGFPT